MKKNISTLFVLIAGLIFLMSSCASSTKIESNPSGAKVFINGKSVGNTPYLYVDYNPSFMSVDVDIVKDGYEPIYTKIRRSDEFNVGNFIGGLFIWPILFWTLDYAPSYTFELVPLALLDNQGEVPLQNNSNIVPLRPKIDRIKELKQMLDEKLINEKEYELQKQKILDEK